MPRDALPCSGWSPRGIRADSLRRSQCSWSEGGKEGSLCGRALICTVLLQRKAKGQELLDLVCDTLNLVEKDYFGLTYEDRHDPRNWVELDRRLSKFFKSEYRRVLRAICPQEYSLFFRFSDCWFILFLLVLVKALKGEPVRRSPKG